MISNAVLFLMMSAVPGAGDSIDSILTDTWKARSIQSAPLCSDEEFLRRVSLDIIGRVPTLDEIRRFQEKPDRKAKIDELLAGSDYPRFWSEVWTATLNGYTDAFESDRYVLRKWLEEAFRKDMPYDSLVTKLIAAKGESATYGPANFLVRHPEQPAVKISQLFLGVRLGCARCHDHPFDRWTQKDFKLMNRFFEATDRRAVSEKNIRLVNEVPHVESDDQKPLFLTGARPRTTQWRDEFALFLTNSKPFARTFANRMWYHFMGRGIVHPPDDFNRENPPSVPKLLDFLTRHAQQNNFAIRPTIRLICNSRAYQLSSEHSASNDGGEAVFAHRILKPLTAEQVFDSAVVALNIQPKKGERKEFIRRTVGESIAKDFSNTWDYRESVQGLMWRLNLQVPAPTDSIDELYLRILTRRPTDAERKLCRGRSTKDIVFALINSNEFFFNH